MEDADKANRQALTYDGARLSEILKGRGLEGVIGGRV